MGIKNLRQLIKKQCPDFETTLPLSFFSEKTVLIDAPLFICVYKAKFKTPIKFKEAFTELFLAFKHAKVNIILVIDGIAPVEKAPERLKRKERKEQTAARLTQIKTDIKVYNDTSIPSPLLLQVHQKINLSPLEGINQEAPNPTPDPTTRREAPDGDAFGIAPQDMAPVVISPILLKQHIKAIEEYIKKQEGHLFDISPEDFKDVSEIGDLCGFSTIQAPGEAEIFCAGLIKTGVADAVLTRDTDVLACSTPITIVDVNPRNQVATVIKMDNLLTSLKLTEKQMLDLCILCGTDYNDNIPRIGCIKAFELIHKYQSLENIEALQDKKKDTKILNYKAVRNLFSCDVEKFILPVQQPLNVEGLSKYILDNQLAVSHTFKESFELLTGKLDSIKIQ